MVACVHIYIYIVSPGDLLKLWSRSIIAQYVGILRPLCVFVSSAVGRFSDFASFPLGKFAP